MVQEVADSPDVFVVAKTIVSMRAIHRCVLSVVQRSLVKMERRFSMKRELALKEVLLMERVVFQKEVKRVVKTVRSPRAPGGGKTKDSGAQGSKSSGGGGGGLPDPASMKSKHINAYMVKAKEVLDSRNEGGGGSKKRKSLSRDEWLALEPDT
jgi:hypothetical protein